MTAYWKIRFRLLRVPGVANVAMWGERLKQLQIQIDPDRMASHRVTLNEVLEAASETFDFGLLLNNINEDADRRILSRRRTNGSNSEPVSPAITPEGLAQIPLESVDGATVRLGDVAKIVWEQPLLIGDAVINDGPGLMLIVEKLLWANTLDVTRAVEAALAEMRPGLPGIEIDSQIFRPATFIELSITNLTTALVVGAALVVLILGTFSTNGESRSSASPRSPFR